MRKVKFRGKSETYKAWIYGVPYYSEGLCWILVDDNTCSEEFGTGSYCVDPETVGQYIGRKDKNDVEIYEGDVLGGFFYQDDVPGDFLGGVIVWIQDEVRFGISFGGEIHEVYFEELVRSDLEVIGNIFDNPELIEEAG